VLRTRPLPQNQRQVDEELINRQDTLDPETAPEGVIPPFRGVRGIRLTDGAFDRVLPTRGFTRPAPSVYRPPVDLMAGGRDG
jgi:hypothetical protein